MYTEVIQNSVIGLIREGRIKFGSACSLTVTNECLHGIYDDMDLAEDMVKYCIKYVMETCADDLALFDKFVEPGLLDKLNNILNSGFARITYKEAIDIMKKVLFQGHEFDREHMAKELFPPFRRIAVSRPGTFKKSDINGMYRIAKALFPEKDIELIPNPDEALEWALDNGKDILVTGSFYLPPEMEKLRRAHES